MGILHINDTNLCIRYHPGPQYTKVKNDSLKPCVDLDGVSSGTHELWLVQMPKQMNMSSINGSSVSYEPAKETSTTGLLGSLETKEGVAFQLHQESETLSKQLFVISSTSTGSGLSMFPVSRRVNLDRIAPEGGPVGVVNARSVEAAKDPPVPEGQTPKKSKKRQVEEAEKEIEDQPDEVVKSKKKKDKSEKSEKKKAKKSSE